MLGKLIKYDLKATARKLFPLYIALIGLAIIINLFIGNLMLNNESSGGIVETLSIFAYGITMAAVFIITLYITLERFYKNLLGREGYLMNTLPVPTWMNISSKLIVSFIWNIVSIIIALLSIIIISYSKELIDQLPNILLFLKFTLQGQGLYILEWIIYLLITIFSSTLIIYLSIALGHLANKRRIILAFVAYIVLSVGISSFKDAINLSLYAPNTLDLALTSNVTGLLIFDILLSVVLFLGCNYIIKNKLNLE